MPAILQRELPMRVLRVKTPMVDMAGAFSALSDATENEITELIDCGFLWAFNIGDTSAKRRELRILAASLAAVQGLADWRELLTTQAPATRTPATWSQALAIILPKHDKPWFTGKEVKRALNCRRQHFIDLVTTGDLRGTTFRRGPGGSPNIARNEFVRFLEARVIGGI